jgi:hypothetical protein
VAHAIAYDNPGLVDELDLLFDDGDEKMDDVDGLERKPVEQFFIETKVAVDDSFAVMARRNLEFFRQKFNQLL